MRDGTQRPTLCAAYGMGMRWQNSTILYARSDKTRLSGGITLKCTLGQGFQLVFSTLGTNLAKNSVPTVHFSLISPKSPTFRAQKYKIAIFVSRKDQTAISRHKAIPTRAWNTWPAATNVAPRAAPHRATLHHRRGDSAHYMAVEPYRMTLRP